MKVFAPIKEEKNSNKWKASIDFRVIMAIIYGAIIASTIMGWSFGYDRGVFDQQRECTKTHQDK